MKTLVLTAALVASMALTTGTRAQAAEGPVAVVEHLHAALLDAMQQGAQLGFAGRRDLLDPVIRASFDFDSIARIVGGRGWKEASEEQRAAFLETFTQFSVATYATNFSAYDGEKFVTVDDEQSRGSWIVRTNLESPGDQPVPLNYMLRESDGTWRIVNVVAQGVSDLSLKRAEYSEIIGSEGFDALIRRLESKVAELGR